MSYIADDLDCYLATTAEMISANSAFDATDLLRLAEAKIEKTGSH
jgi:hypothetical protein